MKALLIPIVSTLLLTYGLCTAVEAQTHRPNLVPWPKKVTMTSGSFALPNAPIVVIGRSVSRIPLTIKVTGRDVEAAKRVADTLSSDLGERGYAADISTKGRATLPRIVLALSKEKALGPEGYRLRVGQDISITAPTEQGLFWGTRTLLQLFDDSPRQPLTDMLIVDKPEFGFRSVMVDVARKFHTIEFHKQMIKKLALYKINVYHIHFCDDDSYTLPSKAFPTLPKPGKSYTELQLRDLVKLAQQYHVTIIPEIDMPGHASALCAGIPDLVCRNRQGGWMICGGSDRAYKIMTTLVSEAMDIFPSPYFHIGADECDVKQWDGCPDCEATKVREGLKDNNALYNWFINRMNAFVKSKGRRTVVWEGFKVGQEPIVDKDVLVEEFAVEYAMPQDVLNAGYDMINTACVPLYVVRHWTVTASPPQSLAEWNALYFANGHPPKTLDQMLKITPSPHLKGVGFCSWENEQKAEEPALFGIGSPVETYVSAPRVPIFAERAWSGSATTPEDLLNRVGVTVKCVD